MRGDTSLRGRMTAPAGNCMGLQFMLYVFQSRIDQGR